jgi:hypothetical protein
MRREIRVRENTMRAKLLFIFGIVVAHGALAAGWVANEAPSPRNPAQACVNSPGALHDYSPAFQIYALNLPRIDPGEVVRP